MVLESTMICLDNSEFMRNGDYNPTRIAAQKDAASVVCTDKIQSNPENTVGLLSMAGKEGIELLVSPTEDIGKILAAFSRVNLGGNSDFSSAVQIAQLALKHRKNKNGGQRIIAFVGSPILEDVQNLKKIGKQLKKNNVAIDIVSMGEIEENHEKLLEFINSANSNDNCHLITVPAGVQPADALQTSNMMEFGGGGGGGHRGGEDTLGGGGGGGSGGFDEYGGIDPSMDPELAMAIRVSTEEARAREEARAATSGSSGTGLQTPAPATSSAAPTSSYLDEEDEEALMQRALALSMQDVLPSSTTVLSTSSAEGEAAVFPSSMDFEQHEDEYEDEDEELREAMRLSLQTTTAPAPAPTTSASTATATTSGVPPSSAFLDADFVKQLLGDVDVDPNDPLIQAALAQMSSNAVKEKEGEEGEESKKRKAEDKSNNTNKEEKK